MSTAFEGSTGLTEPPRRLTDSSLGQGGPKTSSRPARHIGCKPKCALPDRELRRALCIGGTQWGSEHHGYGSLVHREAGPAGGSALRRVETKGMAPVLALAEESLIHLHRGALLHRIGKMASQMRSSTGRARSMKRSSRSCGSVPCTRRACCRGFEYRRTGLDIPNYHCERREVSGYREGLQGMDIPTLPGYPLWFLSGVACG